MQIKKPLNFKLKGKAQYVLQMVSIMTYTKDINETPWWQAHLERILDEGRN